MNKLIKKIRHLSKRKQVILALTTLLVLAAIALLIWGILSGKIKPKAAGIQISNTATVTYQDASGTPHTVPSNTVLVEVIQDGSTVNITLALDAGSNFSTAGTVFAICPTGSSVATSASVCNTLTVAYQNANVTTDSTGSTSLTIAPPAAGNYDYKIKANGYLVKAVKNTPLNNPLELSFGTLKAGDLDGDNTVTAADFIAFRSKYLGSDQIADFDHDGSVTTSDFITFRKNYLQSGD